MRDGVTSRVIRRIGNRVRRVVAHQQDYGLHDLVDANVDYLDVDGQPRLNLVIPAISNSRAFGGISTALRFFATLRQRFPRARIIVVDEGQVDFSNSSFQSWHLGESADRNCVVYLRDAPKLAIEKSDFFIATYWTTAEFLFRARASAPTAFEMKKIVYLIQDFEPAFYQWSSRYLLALSTYQHADSTVAVFNTLMLKEFFAGEGFKFRQVFSFEPKLNADLLLHLTKNPVLERQRILLVYGRPGTARNAFELIVAGLRRWSSAYDKAARWQLVSAGQPHGEIPLSNGLVLKSNGKLSLAEYANLLRSASVGLSLMVSPHPSYPPLEMAEFGLRVVTNQFKNKNLSATVPNIVSLPVVTPDAIAHALIHCCEEFENEGVPHQFGGGFSRAEQEFPFAENLVGQLLQCPEGSPHGEVRS